ncbi:MAG: hypothetical protein VB980_04585 [Opitutales bacterium]
MNRSAGGGKNEMTETDRFEVAFFVSSHGFGHAGRVCAVASALSAIHRDIKFGFFTETPAWFFEDALGDASLHRPCQTDVGLSQDTPFQHDVAKTLDELSAFFPFQEERVSRLAGELSAAGCRLVVCDVSALGIEVAHACGLPAVLLENFTWDWVYEDFLEKEPRFEPFVRGLRETYQKADHHIQTEPVCLPSPEACVVPPISRSFRSTRRETRRELGVPEDAKLGLLTTGGIRGEMSCLKQLQSTSETWFVAPGACSEGIVKQGNLIQLAHRSGFHHPDLAAASDFFVGKAGYGTIAEARASGASFAYVLRDNFRESVCLRKYLAKEEMGFEISEEQFHSAVWLERLDELLATSDGLQPMESGAGQAAAVVNRYLV